MNAIEIHPLVDEGLGNSAYLVDLGDGRALAVDPRRDLAPYLRAAPTAGGCGSPTRPRRTCTPTSSPGAGSWPTHGARVLAAARRPTAQFAHRGLVDGDEVDLGGLTLRALATPGHTAEHLSFLLLDGASQLACSPAGR